MLEQHNVLLVDAGNTNVKYCLYNGAGSLQLLQDFKMTPSELSNRTIKQLIICSVRDKEFAESLESLCRAFRLPFKQVFTEAQAFGTRCAYENYKTLGVDRWMNILAVAKETEGTVITFSIGTAMTIDLIHNRQHKGGWITPGYDMSKQALFNNTEGVFGDKQYPEKDAFGMSTPDCVNFGCRALANGLLREAVNQAKKYSDNVRIKVFGGGLNLLNQTEFDELEVDELLVFKGLSRFI